MLRQIHVSMIVLVSKSVDDGKFAADWRYQYSFCVAFTHTSSHLVFLHHRFDCKY